MKIEAKSRLVATEVTAAIGDAAPLLAAVLEAGKSVQKAIEALDSYDHKVAKSLMSDACNTVAGGIALTFKGKAKISKPDVGVEFYNPWHIPVMGLKGGVVVDVTSTRERLKPSVSWHFNLFEEDPNKFSVWFGDSSRSFFEYRSSRKTGFDHDKYKKIVTRWIQSFEKKGFSE